MKCDCCGRNFEELYTLKIYLARLDQMWVCQSCLEEMEE